MLLAGIATAQIADILGISAPALESRLWEMLRRLEALPAVSRSPYPTSRHRMAAA
jgi:hypothetical protein